MKEENKMKKFFVQTKSPDGESSLSINTSAQIVEMMGFRDCTDCEYEVFAGNEFGALIRLEYVPSVSAPFNYHRFIDPRTGADEISEYSTEH